MNILTVYGEAPKRRFRRFHTGCAADVLWRRLCPFAGTPDGGSAVCGGWSCIADPDLDPDAESAVGARIGCFRD